MPEELPPSDRELDVLKVLWELGSGSVREVHERVDPESGLAFNTVQTVLRNMEEKGLVGHRAEGRTFIYFPVHTREQVTSRFLAKVFGGAHVLPLGTPGGRTLGGDNVQVALSSLRAEGIHVVSEDVGGTRGRKLAFNTVDGTALVWRL